MNIIDFIVSNFNEFLSFTGFANATVGNLIMIVVGIFFIWLAIKKDFEPLLLVPIGLGIVLGNILRTQHILSGRASGMVSTTRVLGYRSDDRFLCTYQQP